jgi:hypothetical protein
MPKFNKPIKKADGGLAERTKAIGQARADYMLGRNKPETEEGIMRGGLANVLASDAIRPLVPTAADMQLMMRPGMTPPVVPPTATASRASGVGRGAAARGSAPVRTAPMPMRRADVPNFLDRDMEFMAQMSQAQPELMGSKVAGFPSLPGGAPTDMVKAAGEIPKTKAGLKKFMQEYGKFIALGAMAGQGGKGGQIAAPIIAALPGLIEMMKGKKKSSGGEPPKKSEGGAIRKFKGGSMKGNTMDSMLTPKYAKGGKTDKMGKAAGEMPQHKKMAMGKPTPQSTGQKFAKGGAAKYAGGGMCKGYGISKKIRPTGPMN